MKLCKKFSQEVNNLSLVCNSLVANPEEEITNEVKYTSQFASPECTEKVLREGMSKKSDPNWFQSGAESVEEYEKWVTTVCGMACSVMALDHFYNKKYQTIVLAKEAIEHGVYKEHSGALSNMQYKAYVDWITNHGIYASLYSRLSLTGIKHVLSKAGLVIASVNPNIRGYQTVPQKQVGGHLVLVTGYSNKKNTVTIQNPSGFVSQNTHHNHELDCNDFKKYFARRGIALYKR